MKEQLTKKLGPMPLWVWVTVAAIAAGGFYLWKKNHSAASSTTSADSSTASSTGSSTLPAGTGYAVVGSYDGPGSGWQGYNNPGPGATTQGPGSTLPPDKDPGNQPPSPPVTLPPTSPPPAKSPVPVKQGGGYWYGYGNETAIQNAANKLWYVWISPQASPGYTGTRYIQVSPNVFTPWDMKTPLLPGTPQFMPSAPPPATTAQVAPGLTMQAQPLNAINNGPMNSGSPASAIAPSALQPITQ